MYGYRNGAVVLVTDLLELFLFFRKIKHASLSQTGKKEGMMKVSGGVRIKRRVYLIEPQKHYTILLTKTGSEL